MPVKHPSTTSAVYARILNHIPLCWGLRQSFKSYQRKDFISDLSAALVVALVALPLSMALAIAIGLPPQHGLYTAIVGGIVAAIFGGSKFQVSGPTAAFVVILIPIVSEFGLRGIIWCQIFAGILLILFAITKLGRLIRFVPYPVTTGFTTGIALVLTTIALKDFIGINLPSTGTHFTDKLFFLIGHLNLIKPFDLLIGMITLLVTIYAKRVIKFIPSSILGVLAGTSLALVCRYYGISIFTIGSEFSYQALDGLTKQGIPPYAPIIHWPTLTPGSLLSLPTMAECRAYLTPSLVIASLAALESLLSATIADSLTGTRHHPNGELMGVGLANIFSGLASGIPATAAIARTATNINNGAKSPISVIFHALFLLVFMLFLSPIIGWIPLSSLSALLILTAYHMSHLNQFKSILRIAPGSDKFVLLTCFGLTVMVDMIAGVLTGIVLAAFLFMKRISDLTNIALETPHSHVVDASPIGVSKGIMIFKIDGPLFFGTVEKAYDRSPILKDDVKCLIIDLEDVPLIDVTGLVDMQSMIQSITREKEVILCGKQKVLNKINRLLSPDIKQKIKLFPSVAEALIQFKIQAPYAATPKPDVVVSLN